MATWMLFATVSPAKLLLDQERDHLHHVLPLFDIAVLEIKDTFL